MQRASEVQQKRAALHYKNRMAETKVAVTERARVELQASVDLREDVKVKETVNVTMRDAQKVKAN